MMFEVLSEDCVGEILRSVMSTASVVDFARLSQTCRALHAACTAHYGQYHTHRVDPNKLDHLAHAVDNAGSGDTIVLESGVHIQTSEVVISHNALRVRGAPGATVATILPVTSVRVCLNDETRDFVSPMDLVTLPTLPMTQSMKHCISFENVTFCCGARGRNIRTYPNACIHVEMGASLRMHKCRVTTYTATLTSRFHWSTTARVYNVVQRTFAPRTMDTTEEDSTSSSDESDIKIGLVVSAGARVCIFSCAFARCTGPLVRVRSGTFIAVDSSFHQSLHSPNIVVNSGNVVLQTCDVTSAYSDGIAIWNHPSAVILERNRFMDNGGFAILLAGTGRPSYFAERNSFLCANRDGNVTVVGPDEVDTDTVDESVAPVTHYSPAQNSFHHPAA